MRNRNRLGFVRRRNLLLCGALALSLAALARPRAASAGGFFLYEIGTPDVGLASAGYAARAQDASTVFTNPAGMTMLDHSQLLAGIQPIYTHLAFARTQVPLHGEPTGAMPWFRCPGAVFSTFTASAAD